jgi:hypothetical protein
MPITQILLTATTAQGGGGGGDTYPLPGSGTYISNTGGAPGGVQGTALNPGGGVESVGNSQNGWAYYIKDGQFNNDTTFFNGVAKTGADTYGGFGDQAKAKEYYAIQWVGYFPVPTTGDYNVHLIGDDLVYFWIGTAALEGNFNLSNYHHSVNNGQDYAGNSVTLTGGLYYPIRMWFQEWSGNEKAQVLIGPAASNALAMNQYTIVNNSQTEGHNPPAPTYTITPVADNVDEGSSLEFTIGGTNITNGTYYWTVDGNGPFDDGENGSFEIANNLGSITVTPTANQNTDGEKTFTLSIRSVDIYGTILATSESITINDTSLTPEPTYTLTPAADNIDEGSSLEFTVGGTNITNGTYYWTVETSAGDFTTNTGEVSVTDNSGSFTVTPTEDSTTEGLETFTVALRSGSVSGSILETSESITINDTSLAPVPPFSLEFNQPQQDFLRVDASSSFNLGNNWTIEFWIRSNNNSASNINIPGGQWGLINQGGWYGGMPDDNCILVGMVGGYLTINQSANDDIQFTEPTTQRWTHVAVVNNGGGSAQKVYYNGVEQAKVTGSYTSNGKTNTSDDIYIGRLAPNYNSHFDGKMAMIRISNTAKYLTAFTPSTAYDVEADTVLFLDSDTPLIGQSYYELNGLTTVASNTSTIYFSKTTYPNLNNQVQAGNTLVDADTSASATVTAVYTPGGDPANWGVDYSPAFGGAVNIANFSGTRSAPVTNNGTTESESFPQALTGIVYPFNGGTYGVIYTVFGDPNLAAVSAVPAYARITSNIPGFGTRTIVTRGSHPTGWLITYDATGLTGTTSQSDVFNFYW